MFLQFFIMFFSMLLFVGMCLLQTSFRKEAKWFSGITVFLWILFLMSLTDFIFSIKTVDPIPTIEKLTLILAMLISTTRLGGFENLKILFRKNLLLV